MRYLLDANVFIQAKNRAYGFDICPGFWKWIDKMHAAGKLASIEKVGDELRAGDDKLAEWAKEKDDDFFLPIDAAVIPSLTEVSTWVDSQPQFTQAARAQFAAVADYYLVAFAHASGDRIVTHEVHRPAAKKVVKLPTVCIGMGVKFSTPWEMLRAEKARFVLK